MQFLVLAMQSRDLKARLATWGLHPVVNQEIFY